MKKIHGAAVSIILLFGGSLVSAAQQPAAASNNGNSSGGVIESISGTGSKDYITLWLGSTKLGNSNIFQGSTGDIGIGTITPAAALDVNGTVNGSSFNLGGVPFAFGTLSSQNAFLGFSGNSTMSGGDNTASGVDALHANTTGYENTASGYEALFSNTTGYLNTAVGVGALALNTGGSQNMAIGGEALQNNTTGNLDTATGVATLAANTTGSNNTAEGWSALKFNTTGDDNTAGGYGAAAKTTSGGGNTAYGMLSLYYNNTGNLNTALGYSAGPDISSTALTNATAIGAFALVSQSNAMVLGGPLGSGYNVNVGIGTATPSNVFTIAQGAGQAISDGWSVYSSRRWKTNIHTLQGALAKVEQLRGVSYDLQSNGKHQVGVIAEEVGAVLPEVVTWEKNGKDAQSVDYSRLTALLIEATKEQQALIQKQQEQIERLAAQVKTIRASLKESRQTGSEVHRVKAQVRTVVQ